MIDLLGMYTPTQSSKTISFEWQDGLFIRALKEGHWVLLNELNLASQTVLEGLNSILDHRGNIFIPDINQTIVKHDGFRIFATQNPFTKVSLSFVHE